jgi:hypothetical protein
LITAVITSYAQAGNPKEVIGDKAIYRQLSPLKGSVRQSGCLGEGSEMTLWRVLEIVIIVVVIYLAVRLFRKRG